ncbi:unnamed protein product [Amoebophrya sp. A120]|nr:unnamed protein product [Amoebophrya sp. A120]|eukprot:GSA120T00013448001.1
MIRHPASQVSRHPGIFAFDKGQQVYHFIRASSFSALRVSSWDGIPRRRTTKNAVQLQPLPTRKQQRPLIPVPPKPKMRQRVKHLLPPSLSRMKLLQFLTKVLNKPQLLQR